MRGFVGDRPIALPGTRAAAEGGSDRVVGRARPIFRQVLLFVTVTVSPLLVPAGALAHLSVPGWATTGGAGGTPQHLVVRPGVPTALLAPGYRADVAVTIENPNRRAVHLGALVLDSGDGAKGLAVDPGHAGCSLAALSYSSQSNSGRGWTVAPRTRWAPGSLSVDLTDALSMAAWAARACEGASFTVYLAAGP